MLKKILLALVIVSLCYQGTAFAVEAFKSDVKVLNKEAVTKLTDDQLIEQYVDVIIELEAKNTFYRTSGMVPKDFTEYKSLVRFRILLVMEIHNRNLETPAIESRQ